MDGLVIKEEFVASEEELEDIFPRSLEKRDEDNGQANISQKFMCKVCGKCLSTKSNLKQHDRIHTGERPFECPFCGKAFQTSSSLNVHKRLHTGERPYPCKSCDRTFLCSNHLKRHARSHIPKLECPQCGKSVEVDKMEEHHELGLCATFAKARKKVPRISHACGLCGKTFTGSAALTSHKKMHGKKKTFKCESCDKAYNNGSALLVHRRVHSGQGFVCETCGQRFLQNSHLTVHRRAHSGETPFKCEYCAKGFKQSSNLKDHVRLHTGERPFTCECGKRFRQTGHLKDHQRNYCAFKTKIKIPKVVFPVV
ncbi:zinc finger protein 135-like [Asterias rubens]|uniref:zinc finger protein 135-like n=1 Tax=Asterias rubens TaxID=7604 RepID=UPI001455CE08|nr:zinc finger protein 135-like [Asterias rubens]